MSKSIGKRSRSVCSINSKELEESNNTNFSEELKLAAAELRQKTYEYLQIYHISTKDSRRFNALLCTLSLILILLIISIFRGNIKEKIKYSYAFTHIYWILLGCLSSIGVGSGLHTFTLYLSPFVLENIMKSAKCGNLDFESPPYPWELICGERIGRFAITSEDIYLKVMSHTLAWGIESGLGELPPYVIAKSIHKLVKLPIRRLSITRQSIKYIKRQSTCNISDPNIAKEYRTSGLKERFETNVGQFIQNFGFWAILLMSSIPNPFFDIVGIACGYFDVKLSIFLSATLIGKAFIKAQLQVYLLILSVMKIKEKSFANNLEILNSGMMKFASNIVLIFSSLFFFKALIHEMAEMNLSRQAKERNRH